MNVVLSRCLTGSLYQVRTTLKLNLTIFYLGKVWKDLNQLFGNFILQTYREMILRVFTDQQNQM